ncbi:NAD-dependent epimerase/dehydratase family protein [bacterium]|nr:NAD-dependent epimerase/dehydratase family protein [bacterium]
MKVLVTGGKGFVGSHLAVKMRDLGNEVIVIDDESAEENDKFYEFEGIEYHTQTILDPSTEWLYKDVDIVFHAAAKARIQPSVSKPGSAFETNVLGTQTVCNFSKNAGVKRIIYSASSSCYGKKNNPPFLETMNVDCQTPYSLSKWMGEEVCRLYSNLYGIETVLLRYFNVYGPREPKKGHYAPVIGLFKRQEAAGEPHTIVGSGLQKRDFTYIDDIIDASVKSISIDPLYAKGEIFNIGTGTSTSIMDVSKMIGSNRIKIADRVGESVETLADITKARQILKYKPSYNLKDVIDSY